MNERFKIVIEASCLYAEVEVANDTNALYENAHNDGRHARKIGTF